LHKIFVLGLQRLKEKGSIMKNPDHAPENLDPRITSFEEREACRSCLPDILNGPGRILIWRGIVFLLFGVLLWVRPLAAIPIVVMIFGVYVGIEAIAMLIGMMQYPTGSSRALMLLNAVILLLLGVAAVVFPWVMGEYAIIFLGAWQLISGIQCVLLTSKAKHRAKTFFSGILSILAGIFFIAAPFIGLLTLSWLFAMLFVASGITMLVAGVGNQY